jgi:hypothetical protein
MTTLNEVHDLLAIWHSAKEQADLASLAEKEARKKLIEAAFPTLVEGAGNKYNVGFGKTLQVTGVITRKLDMAALDAIRAEGKVAPDVIDSIVRQKPELVVATWKALPVSIRETMADAVEEKWGSHQVKLVAQKDPD